MNNYNVLNNKFFLAYYRGEIIKGSEVSFHETIQSEIWLINPNNENLQLTILELIDNINKHSWEIPGVWAAIVKNKKGGFISAICSINGEFNWYYSESNPELFSNSLFYYCAQTNMKNADLISIASYIGLDWSIGGFSMIQGIKKSYGGSIITLTNKGILEKKVDLKVWLGFDNSIKGSDALFDLLIEICRNILKDSKVQLTLTSGQDSRALLIACLKTNLPFTLMTSVASTIERRDRKIPKAISNKLKIPHLFINSAKLPSPGFEDVFQRFAIEFDSEFIPTNYLLFYKEYINSPNRDTKILGYGGEYYSGFYDNVLQKIKHKLFVLEDDYVNMVLDRAQKRLDTLKDISERDANDLFYQRERDHFWVGANVKAYINYNNIYNPLKDPRLVALGYRINGGIRSSQLHKNILSRQPEGIKKIPTNYKFPLSEIIKIKQRLYNKLDYSYMLRPNDIERSIDYSFFNPLIPERKIKLLIKTYRFNGLFSQILHKLVAIQYFFKSINY